MYGKRMNELFGVAETVQTMGGYGVAAVMYWFLKTERDERLRYRDLHEETLRALPDLTRSIEKLVSEVEDISNGLSQSN